jgi:hypothetical protein
LLCCGHPRIAGTKVLARRRALRSIVNRALKKRLRDEREDTLDTNVYGVESVLIL